MKIKALAKIWNKIRSRGSLEEAVIVGTGHMRYSNGPVISRDFAYCSAVVLDFGNKGVLFTHTFPSRYFNDSAINSSNVVAKLVEGAEQRQLDPRKSQALVNAGSEESLDRIVDNLKSEGVPNIVVNRDLAPACRDVSYAPNQGYLVITPFYHQ
tara:strand:- start:6834 stop:7295 length:462 start_codon:yes stop_codon:yes gene_type:complete